MIDKCPGIRGEDRHIQHRLSSQLQGNRSSVMENSGLLGRQIYLQQFPLMIISLRCMFYPLILAHTLGQSVATV